ncbi:hypothetical protein SBOR_6247 [Sclerotinia borealis F-4128]|uniref:Uncharacterized protein n=1 Tax=Sclerotinia borealis (strain F-4128) TaxID=1432307 RepID=W9CFS7_SCLBF|nr:hypothetical protein SBOR_6247 [Sclerotinia borealis F-4128]
MDFHHPSSESELRIVTNNEEELEDMPGMTEAIIGMNTTNQAAYVKERAEIRAKHAEELAAKEAKHAEEKLFVIVIAVAVVAVAVVAVAVVAVVVCVFLTRTIKVNLLQNDQNAANSYVFFFEKAAISFLSSFIFSYN